MTQPVVDSRSPDLAAEPPGTFWSSLTRVGPGLVVAGSIVGSGELIATTKTGAQAGFALLWLIVLGCVVKVLCQVELGRHSVASGETTLRALDGLPGPRLGFGSRIGAGWGVWAWSLMTVLVICQQGGIVGSVGEALAMALPLTEAGSEVGQLSDRVAALKVQLAAGAGDGVAAQLEQAQAELATLPAARDAVLWAGGLAVLTAVILVVGRYGLIQAIATAAVVSFTLVTVITLLLLQREPSWAVSGEELRSGLAFRLPEASPGKSPMGTALATFGIIGVGAAELVMYPYWCLEKGYARWTGPVSAAGFADRARGWLRVLRLDAWLSAAVYTFATVAFYLLGAAVLWRADLDPERGDVVRTLGQMYVPVFGSWARALFLGGAFCVLYSTYFVASAGIARIAADALIVLGLVGEEGRARWTRILCAFLPLSAFAAYAVYQAPVALVLASGVAQALMLPVLGGLALWLRYRRPAPGLAPPSKLWDVGLWLSFLSFTVVGGWLLVTRF